MFLVGAGCSVDAPSCLPAGRAAMKAIIEYACVDSEKAKILNLKELRFEQLVEIIRDRLDPELKIIDYYGQCDQPNLQHFFLAEMIKKGHIVLTTNFDHLIEYALLKSGVPKEDVVPVITKSDFERYSDPAELYKKGNRAVYKIHGSPKNAITGENTKKSLVATIQAFGSNKEGLKTFQVEPFKKSLFENASIGHSIVIMGYSGSDDFDVVPTLLALKNLDNLIWINHISNDGGLERVSEVEVEVEVEAKALDSSAKDKIDQILRDAKRLNIAKGVYRVQANTPKLLQKISYLELKTEGAVPFSLSLTDWSNKNIMHPSNSLKLYISNKIYFDFNMYEDSMRCSEAMLLLAEKEKEQHYKSVALGYIGQIHHVKGNYPEALKRYEEALKIDEELGDLSEKSVRLNNIGEVFRAKGNYPEALKWYEEALKVTEQLGDLKGKATILNNTGEVFRAKGNYPEALKRYKEALKIDELLGNLKGKAVRLNNIGLVYDAQGNYSEALKRYEEALKTAEQLGDLKGKSSLLNNIGRIYNAQGNYSEAMKRYEEALKIDEQLGNLKGKAVRLNNIGQIHQVKGNYSEAMKRYEEALKIDEQLGDLSEKAVCLSNIGQIHHIKGNYSEAMKRYEESLKIAEQLGELKRKAIHLNNIGLIYKEKGNHSKAMKRYEESLKIAEQLGDLKGKATLLSNIASIHYDQGNYPETLRYFKNALQILTELGLSESPSAKTIEKNIKSLKS